MPLTLQDVTTFVPSLSSAPAATISAMLPVAYDFAQKYCNRIFLKDSVVENYSYRFSGNIYLKRVPVETVTRIRLLYSTNPIKTDSCGYVLACSSEISDYTDQYVNGTIGYRLSDKTGFMRIDRGISISVVNTEYFFYEVTYTGGFDDEPEAVKMAISLIVQDLFATARTDSAYTSEKIGDYSYTRAERGPIIKPGSDISQLLLPYVRFGANGI